MVRARRSAQSRELAHPLAKRLRQRDDPVVRKVTVSAAGSMSAAKRERREHTVDKGWQGSDQGSDHKRMASEGGVSLFFRAARRGKGEGGQ